MAAALLSCASTLLFFELLLRNNTFERPREWLGYQDLINQRWEPGGRLRPSIHALALGPGRSSVPWITNDQGFRNPDPIPESPPADSLRVLSVGDSFTVGYRLDREDTFSAQWERWLRANHNPNTQVLIALAEDPVNASYYLSRFGQRFEPHLIILGVTLGNDIAQAYMQLDPRGFYRNAPEAPGGLERVDAKRFFGFARGLDRHTIPKACLAESATREHTPVWRRSAVAGLVRRVARRVFPPDGEAPASHYGDGTPRLFDPNHGLGFFLKDPPAEIDTAFERLFTSLVSFKRVCREGGAECVVILFPQRFQVRPADWEATVATYGLEPGCFDLAAPNRRIVDFCRESGLTCLDPTASMAAMSESWDLGFYQPAGDMHWNALGNRALFEISRPVIDELARKVQSPQ